MLYQTWPPRDQKKDGRKGFLKTVRKAKEEQVGNKTYKRPIKRACPSLANTKGLFENTDGALIPFLKKPYF